MEMFHPSVSQVFYEAEAVNPQELVRAMQGR